MASIDENNLLVFNPETASIIFTAGEGILTKSKKIIASLTQALILFSDKVVNQEINFIRFQNHRMVFIHELDLYGVKLVPKDQLTKAFVPSIKIILNILNQVKTLDESVQELANNPIRSLYYLLTNPEKNLYVFPESIEGYLSLLTIMAGLNYDLSINLESIKNNFLILKEDSFSKLKELDLNKFNGILSFGIDISNQIDSPDKIDLIQFDLKDSIFNLIFPNNKSIYKLLTQVIGTESSAYIISQIINREQSINEVALSLVKLPESEMAVEIAIEAISNFSKEQRLAKPLYRIIIKRLKDLEGNIDINLNEYPEQVSKSNTFKQKISNTVQEQPKVESKANIETNIIQDTTSAEINQASQKGFTASELSSLASEFTSKLETLTKNDANEPNFTQTATYDNRKDDTLTQPRNVDISSLKIDKNHMFMENFKIYFDFTPFRLGLQPEPISYRPSIQIVRINNDTSQINVKISPTKHDWFSDICKNLQKEIDLEFTGNEGIFEITTNNLNLNDILRMTIWSSIIGMIYSIQSGEIDMPDIFNISNKSNLCVILDLTAERKKQLPSQIEVIIEEEKQSQGTGVEDLVNSFDTTLVALSNALKTKKGVGFVLRKNSKELPLVLEFVLTLSEVSGIGWSRW